MLSHAKSLAPTVVLLRPHTYAWPKCRNNTTQVYTLNAWLDSCNFLTWVTQIWGRLAHETLRNTQSKHVQYIPPPSASQVPSSAHHLALFRRHFFQEGEHVLRQLAVHVMLYASALGLW